MLRMLCLVFFGMVPVVTAQTREEKVRADKKKIEAAGYWLYNDISKAFSLAKESNKPMIVVLRCLPCEECVKLDDELIDADESIKKLLEQFVRVRVVYTNGLDLRLFQFDTDQSFAVFFLNADGTIYGRFGTRSHRSEWLGDVSVRGLASAMEAVLELHQAYPKNRPQLLAKTGSEPKYPRPETFPSLATKYRSTIDYAGKVVQSCIHCHQIGDAQREIALKNRVTFDDQLLFPYPHPRSIGLILDPNYPARVIGITPDSVAAQAGLKIGDDLKSLQGQPLISMADVQWVLHQADPKGLPLPVQVLRAGKLQTLTMTLNPGWRQKEDLSWRVSTWGLRRALLGGMYLTQLDSELRKQAKLPEGVRGLYVQHVGQFAPHDFAKQAGVQKGDILLRFHDQVDLNSETEVLQYSLRQINPGSTIPLVVFRNGTRKSLNLKLPQ